MGPYATISGHNEAIGSIRVHRVLYQAFAEPFQDQIGPYWGQQGPLGPEGGPYSTKGVT